MGGELALGGGFREVLAQATGLAVLFELVRGRLAGHGRECVAHRAYLDGPRGVLAGSVSTDSRDSSAGDSGDTPQLRACSRNVLGRPGDICS